MKEEQKVRLNEKSEELYKILKRLIPVVCQECRSFADRYDSGYTQCDLNRPCLRRIDDARQMIEYIEGETIGDNNE